MALVLARVRAGGFPDDEAAIAGQLSSGCQLRYVPYGRPVLVPLHYGLWTLWVAFEFGSVTLEDRGVHRRSHYEIAAWNRSGGGVSVKVPIECETL